MGQPDADTIAVHVLKPSTLFTMVGLYLGCLALVGVAAVGFLIAIKAETNALALQATTTLPLLGAIGCLLAALSMRKAPGEIHVCHSGLKVVRSAGATVLPWDRIASISQTTAALTYRQGVTLLDADGNVLLKFGEEMTGFPVLREYIDQRFSATPHPKRAVVDKKKSRKQAYLLIVVACFAMALGGINAWLTYHDARADRLLRETGVSGTGTIVRKFTAPNGATRRIEYRADTAGPNTPPRNVEVQPTFWSIFVEGQKIPIRYAPSDPTISKLEIGEVAENERFESSPAARAVMSAGIVLFGIVCLGAARWELKKSRRHLQS